MLHENELKQLEFLATNNVLARLVAEARNAQQLRKEKEQVRHDALMRAAELVYEVRAQALADGNSDVAAGAGIAHDDILAEAGV